MKHAALLTGALTLGFVSCSPPPSQCCVRRSGVARDVVYSGSVSSDGGAPTSIRLSVATDGGTVITFVNGGHEIAQHFDTVP